MKKNGFMLVEIVIALGIFSIIISSVIQLFLTSQEASGIGQNKTRAMALMTEYFESLKNLRRRLEGWNSLTNGRYIITTTLGNITLQATTSGETIDSYTRYLTIEDAYRDQPGKLVETGGTQDPSTKKITVVVSWEGLHPAQISQSSFLTRYLDNLVWTRTTEAEFNQGTINKVAVVNNKGGEIILGGGGHGDWCNPGPAVVAELNLPKNGVSMAISAREGRAFVGTGENASGVSMADISISNTYPPIPSIIGTVDGYKTNDVFISGDYGYIATDNNQKEVVIVDLKTHKETGYFDVPGQGNGNGVYVTNNVGYVTAGSKLYLFDLSSQSGSRNTLSEISLPGTANKLQVVNNFAYVATTASAEEMVIIDVTNPASPSIVGWADVNGNQGQTLFINETATRAYLTTSASSTLNEFFIVDVTSKIGNRPLIGSYDTNGMDPKGVTVVTGNRAIVVGTGAEEYQVIKFETFNNVPEQPIHCGGLQVDTGINGVAGVREGDGDAYSYIITGDTDKEFKIIEGGPGGQYTSSGYWESATLDANHSSAFNRFLVTFETPTTQTTVKFQAAVIDPLNGSCANATFDNLDFVGPDGTSLSYFTNDDAIPLNDDGTDFENPGQCFRFRVYLETNEPSQTPTFYEFTVNYSP